MSQWDFGGPPPAHSDDFEGGAFRPISYERDPYYPPAAPPTRPLPDQSWPPRVPPRRGSRRLIAGAVVAAFAAAAGAGTVLLTGGHPASRASGAAGAPGASGAPARQSIAPPGASASASAGSGARPVTMARATRILAGYTTANNKANAAMSDGLLAGIETGSSYAIDAGIYRVQRAEKAAPYPAFGPQQAQFYIPREPAGSYPRWFVAQVVNTSLAAPRKVDGIEYLVFTQAAPGAPWRDAAEPYVLGGQATPRVAVGADGLATPVSANTTSLAIAPAAIARATAAALDGAPAGPANPGNLADGLDQAFWHKKLPAATVRDQHAPGPGQVFGLRTTGGGALFFYTDSARLSLTPPAGEALHLTIPGFFSPGQARSGAAIGYLEQFATYVPPRGGSGLRIVGDYSGITQR